MSTNDLISVLLDTQQIPFKTIKAPDTVSLREDWIKKTVPLHSVSHISVSQDANGMVIAFYPADHQINQPQLQATLHRLVQIIDDEIALKKIMAASQLPGFEPEHENGFQIIIDEHLTNQDYIYFVAPGSCTLFKVEVTDFERVASDALLGSSFSTPPEPKKPQARDANRISLKERIKKIDRLPVIPDMPSRILAIRDNPQSTVDDLVAIIETDMSLSVQIIRYSNSAMFNNTQTVTSLKDAIFRVLGYETVLHLALGYSLGRVFKLPETGPLGQEDFWKHATYSAALVQQLSTAMPRGIRPKPGMVYLAGLLHDIGFLVLNLFFPNEHAWLNKMIAANPDASILKIEQRLLGTSHNELGAWLMEAWNMPKELSITVAEHHNLNYDGPHATYANLLNLSERLLKMHGMSDSDTDEIPDELLAKLGLNEEDVFEITDEVLQGGEILKAMATSVCA